MVRMKTEEEDDGKEIPAPRGLGYLSRPRDISFLIVHFLTVPLHCPFTISYLSINLVHSNTKAKDSRPGSKSLPDMLD